MTTLNAAEARAKLYRLIDLATVTHQPIAITGKRGMQYCWQKDRNAINKTLYLLSVPGMRESVREGLATDLNACAKELDW